MKKLLHRTFAVLMVVAIAITAIPMLEAKAAETKEVTLTYYWYDVDEGVSYLQEKIIIEDGLTYGEFEELYLPTPETDEHFNFIGWESDYNPDDLVTGTRLYYDATYDKYPVDIVKVYVDANNNVIVQEFKNYYEAGTSFAEILPEYTENPNDMGTQYEFTKWNTSIHPADKVGINKTYCEIFADYAEYNIIKLSCKYVQDMGEYGVPVTKNDYVFVDKYLATAQYDEELQAYFEENYAPNDHFNALGFIEYEWWNGDNWDAEDDAYANDDEWALYVSNYTKPQVVLETEDGSRVYAGEPGQFISLPTEIDGARVTWKCKEDGQVYAEKYMVPTDVDGSDTITLRAVFEKIDMTIMKQEYSEEGQWIYSMETINAPVNASIEEWMAMLSPPKEVAGLTFEGWTYLGNWEDSIPTVRANYDKTIVTYYWNYLGEDGKVEGDSETLVLETDATYRDVLSRLNAPGDVLGCSFVKWQLADMDASLDDKIETTDFGWKAIYDKYPVTIEKIYIDSTGAANVEETVKLYTPCSKMEDIYKENITAPVDALNSSVEWFEPIYEYEGEVDLYNNEINYLAKYEDKVIVGYSVSYIEDVVDYGKNIYNDYEYIVLDNETCRSADKLEEYYLNTIIPDLNVKHFQKLDFTKWLINGCYDTTGDGYYNYIDGEAIYDTSDVIILDGWVTGADIEYIWTVEAGQSFTLPYNYDGYYLTWYENGNSVLKDDVYKVPEDAVKGDWYALSAEKDGKIPTKNDTSAKIENANGVLPLGVSISSEKIESGTIFDVSKKLVDETVEGVKNFTVFEINMYDKDGVALEQLGGKIKLYVQMPFEVQDGNELLVFRVESEKLIPCEVASYEKNQCVFLTDHFSTYVFVEKEKAEEDKPTVPQTSDATTVLPYMLLLLCGVSAFLVGNKKRSIF